MSRIDFPKIYNPANQTVQELIDNFVVRTEIFKEIFEEIKSSEMQYPEQHYIIQGIRGQGKTTLLLRIAYEIENDQRLKSKLVPVIFNEEQYNISRLYKLWETIAEYLADSDTFSDLYEKMRALDESDDYEWNCFQLLETTLKKQKKKLILFIDNIDEMLTKFSTKEHQRIREVLVESAELRIIGASSVSMEFHHDYGKPFYQFFSMPQLKGLTSDETNALLLKLGQQYKRERVQEIVKTQPGRAEALRRMTGGVIRTIVILFDIFVDDTEGSAFYDLEKILDSVTPLYKHRMDKLSAQQQEIVDCIALQWDAVGTKEIAQKTRLESKAVSSQLKKLERFYIIEKVKTGTKNHLYRISERFFNIWYLMRLGRKGDEKRVRFLVEFLQTWCDNQELEIRAKKHMEAIKQNKLPDTHAFYLTQALASTSIQRDLQHDLICTTRSFLQKSKSELTMHLSKSDNELRDSTADYLGKNEIEAAKSNLEKIKTKNADDLIRLGWLNLQGVKDIAEAEKCFQKADTEGHLIASFYLAILYKSELKELKKAEKYYLMAVKKEVPEAMFSLAFLYESEFKDIKKAEKYYLLAVEKEYSQAMLNLALLYHIEFKNFKKAEKYYLMAVERKLPEAMHILAIMYYEGKINRGKAIKLAEQAFSISKDTYYALTLALVSLWNNDFKKAVELSSYFLNNQSDLDKNQEGVSQFLIMLIAKKQYFETQKIFNKNKFGLKDRFKPIYYSLMFFLKEEYPNEYLKMGSELQETVNEIIAEVRQIELDYE